MAAPHRPLPDVLASLLQFNSWFESKPIQHLGSGSYGNVYKVYVTKPGEEPFWAAVKLVPLERISSHSVREVLNHYKLRGHPHIVDFRFITQVGNHQVGKYLAIVMQFAGAGTLLDLTYCEHSSHTVRLGPYESIVQYRFQQLAIAVAYMHGRNICSRDIKLENVLLSKPPESGPDYFLHICDFGYSRDQTFSAAATYGIGSMVYMAPEIISASGVLYDGRKADIWSLGVVLYHMMYGQLPFCHGRSTEDMLRPDNRGQLLNMMVNAGYQIPEDYSYSVECKEVLSRMLDPNPATRISIDEILQTQWFQSRLSPGLLEYNGKLRAWPDDQETLEQMFQVLENVSRDAPARHLPTINRVMNREKRVLMAESKAFADAYKWQYNLRQSQGQSKEEAEEAAIACAQAEAQVAYARTQAYEQAYTSTYARAITYFREGSPNEEYAEQYARTYSEESAKAYSQAFAHAYAVARASGRSCTWAQCAGHQRAQALTLDCVGALTQGQPLG